MLLGDRLHAVRPRPLGRDDLLQPHDGRLEIVVDDDVVVVDVARRLAARGVEPPLHLLLGVLAAAAQPLLEHLERRRHHENRRVVDAARLHLPRALHVDHQHDILAIGDQPGSTSAGGRAVIVAEDVGPLEKLAAVDPLPETRRG